MGLRKPFSLPNKSNLYKSKLYMKNAINIHFNFIKGLINSSFPGYDQNF